MSLLQGVPGVLGPWVFALVGVQKNRKVPELLFDFFLGGGSVQQEDIIWVVELVVGETVELYLHFHWFPEDGLVLDRVDLLGQLRHLLPRLVGLTSS